MDLLSEDQKGNFPPSVPSNAFTAPLSIARTKSICFASEIPANTRLFPSGESTGAPAWSPNVTTVIFGGNVSVARTTGPAVMRRFAKYPTVEPVTAITAAPSTSAPACRQRAFLAGTDIAFISVELCEIHASSCLMSAALCQRSSGFFARHLRNDVINSRWGHRPKRADRLRLLLQNRAGHTELALAFKRLLARQHLIEHRAQRENVAARVEFLSFHLFWRHVLKRSYHHAFHGDRSG